MKRHKQRDARMVILDEARAAIDNDVLPPTLDPGHGMMTRSVHGGDADVSSATPIYQGNTVGEIYAYTRYSNPTIQSFEANFRELEGGAGTIATGSGMAAVSQTLLGLLRAGDRLVVHRDMFVGVRSLLEDFLSQYAIEIVAIDVRDLDQLARTLERPTRIVLFETVVHPANDVLDAPAVLRIVGASEALAVVDNTYLTPCLYRPLDDGADVVIHSATKYVGGHGDAIAGVVTTRTEELARKIRKARRILGGVLSPMNAYLLLRGLKTLPMRMERHSANALEVARFLDRHPRVAKVYYPGLTTSPYHATAASFLDSFGGLVGFELARPEDKEPFGAALALCKVRFSFGETQTVVLLQDEVDAIRISVGLEDPDDVIQDLARALDAGA